MAKSLPPLSHPAPVRSAPGAAHPPNSGEGGWRNYFHGATFLGSLIGLLVIVAAAIGWLMVSLPDYSSPSSHESALPRTTDVPLITSGVVAEMNLTQPDESQHDTTQTDSPADEGLGDHASAHTPPTHPAPPDTASPGPTSAHEDGTNTHPDAHHESAAPNTVSLTPVSDKDDHDFYEPTKLGDLPIRRAKDGQSVFDRYKIATHPGANAKGVISLVIADFGLSAHDITTLNDSGLTQISVIFSPYTKDLQKKIDTVRGLQVEPWINAPVEDDNFGENDPGPYSLISGLNDDQNALRLMTILASAKHVPGVVFLNPPNFAAAPDALAAIIGQMDRRGVALASAAAATDDLSAQAAQKFPNLVFLHGATWIDGGVDQDVFTQDLKKIETQALSTGSAMVVIPMQPASLKTLQQWQKTLGARGLELAPLSALKTYGGH